MDHGHQAQAAHYAAPSTYYTPSAPTASTIGPYPRPNPNPSFDERQIQVPVSVPQVVDASLTSPVGYSVAQYQASTYGSYPAAIVDAGGAGLAAAYFNSMPTVGPSYTMKKKKKVNRRATAQDLEAKKQKLIETGADTNSVRACTYCNVVCNSDTVFATHIASERHISRVNGRQTLMNQQAVYSTNASTQNKKPKKKKQKTTSAVRAPTVAQSVYCDVCKITCNTQEMYNNHVSGKKHNRKIQNLTIGDRLIQFVPEGNNLPKSQTPSTNDNDNRNVYCDICKITCNTLEMYNIHLSGKKHSKKIKNLTMGDRPIQSVPATSTLDGTHSPATNDNDQEPGPGNSQMETKPERKSKIVSKEDLETKKRKMLENGTRGDSFKVCELCNVVCNDPKVFEYHCQGQKHRSMVKKQEENLVGANVAHAAVASDMVSAQMAAATS